MKLLSMKKKKLYKRFTMAKIPVGIINHFDDGTIMINKA